MNLAELREEYRKDGLEKEDLAPCPVAQFERWFAEVKECGQPEPNAMVLATVDAGGSPYTRTVLLKAFDERGFVFYTNYNSRKALHIAGETRVALSFFWLTLERQVQIRGHAEKVPVSESLKYFSTRPRGSQLGAWVSDQSSVISSRKLLEMQLKKMKDKFADGKIPLPDYWGGYRVKPFEMEFWQGRQNRLHDRFLYRMEEGGTTVERLAP